MKPGLDIQTEGIWNILTLSHLFFLIELPNLFSPLSFTSAGGGSLSTPPSASTLLFNLLAIPIIFFALILKLETLSFLPWPSSLVRQGPVKDLRWSFFPALPALLGVRRGGLVGVIMSAWTEVEGILRVVEVDSWDVWVYVLPLWTVRGWSPEEADLPIFKGGRL